jgi:LysM repeat protein
MPTYTVAKGDTLSAIGAKVGVPWQQLYEANKSVVGGNPNLIKPGQVLNYGAPTPTSVNGQTPPGDISNPKPDTTIPTVNPPTGAIPVPPGGTPSTGAGTGKLGNLQLALRDALNEAGKRRTEQGYGQIADVASNVKPGGMGSVVDLIRNNIKTSTASIYKTTVDNIDKQQQDAKDAQTQALKTLGTLADAGALNDMSDAALTVLGDHAGLPEGTALAWRAKLQKAEKQSDEKYALEIQNIKSTIAKRNSSGNGNGNGIKNPLTLDEINNKYDGQLPRIMVGMDESQVLTDMQSSTVPDWFIHLLVVKNNKPATPADAQQLWDKMRHDALFTQTTNTKTNTTNTDVLSGQGSSTSTDAPPWLK